MATPNATIAPMTIQKFSAASKNGNLEVHAHHPGQHDARQQHRGQEGQDLHRVVRVLGRPAHVDLERAEEQVAEVLDRIERPVEAIGQARPRFAQLLVERHVRPGERRERHPMRSERPTDQPDPAAHPDDLAQDAGIRPMPERAFVEAVDLALDVLDQLEVVGQHLVGDRGDEARRVERTEARLTLGRRVEPRERREWLVVDRHDPVPCRPRCRPGAGPVALRPARHRPWAAR